MGLKDNLSQAFKELMNREGLVGSELEKKAKAASELDSYLDIDSDVEADVQPDSSNSVNAQQNTSDTTGSNGVKAKGVNDWPEPPSFEKHAPDAASIFSTVERAGGNREFQPSEEVTVISKNTVIDGNVRTLASMTIDGSIRGKVDVMKDSKIRGMLIGDLVCNNSEMYGCSIQGNVFAKGSVRIDHDALLLGDLKAQYINVDGKIKGNIDAGSKIQLQSNAIIIGNISAGSIAITDGANVSGYVNTTFLQENGDSTFPKELVFAEEQTEQ